MFSTGNKAKKTIFGAMTCSKCGKTLNNDENITIKINTKELKGYTHLSSWADAPVSYTHL